MEKNISLNCSGLSDISKSFEVNTSFIDYINKSNDTVKSDCNQSELANKQNDSIIGAVLDLFENDSFLKMEDFKPIATSETFGEIQSQTNVLNQQPIANGECIVQTPESQILNNTENIVPNTEFQQNISLHVTNKTSSESSGTFHNSQTPTTLESFVQPTKIDEISNNNTKMEITLNDINSVNLIADGEKGDQQQQQEQKQQSNEKAEEKDSSKDQNTDESCTFSVLRSILTNPPKKRPATCDNTPMMGIYPYMQQSQPMQGNLMSVNNSMANSEKPLPLPVSTFLHPAFRDTSSCYTTGVVTHTKTKDHQELQRVQQQQQLMQSQQQQFLQEQQQQQQLLQEQQQQQQLLLKQQQQQRLLQEKQKQQQLMQEQQQQLLMKQRQQQYLLEEQKQLQAIQEKQQQLLQEQQKKQLLLKQRQQLQLLLKQQQHQLPQEQQQQQLFPGQHQQQILQEQPQQQQIPQEQQQQQLLLEQQRQQFSDNQQQHISLPKRKKTRAEILSEARKKREYIKKLVAEFESDSEKFNSDGRSSSGTISPVSGKNMFLLLQSIIILSISLHNFIECNQKYSI